MKQVWCQNEVINDLSSVLQNKKPDKEASYPCVDVLSASLESIESVFVKHLKQYNKTLIRIRGRLSLVQQTRIFQLEQLVKILKEVRIILENFTEWARERANVTSYDMISTMSQRMNIEIRKLTSDWVKEGDVIIDVSQGAIVEKQIQNINSHASDLLQAMRLSSYELNNSGILTPIVNNFVNGERIFSHDKTRHDNCFTHSVLAFCGPNLFKTEKVNLEQESNLDGIEFMSSNVIDTLLYQMPVQYRVLAC